MQLKKSTIKEIAKLAQVSTATVSRILNGKSGHRRDTEEYIRKIAAELESSRSPQYAIGILMFVSPDFMNNHYSSSLLTSIYENMPAKGIIGIPITVTEATMNLEYIRTVIREYNIKGLIILMFERLDSIMAELKETGFPLVCIGYSSQNPGCSVQSFDYELGCNAINYLWSLGHRKFGILCMNRKVIGQELRLSGFYDTLKALGGSENDIWLKEYYHLDNCIIPVAEFLNLGEKRPSAVFSTNSEVTIATIHELEQNGIRIPEDLSILSVEENGELGTLRTPVTVLQQQTKELGKRALNLLLRQIRGEAIECLEQIHCKFVLRKTTIPFHCNQTAEKEKASPGV